MKIRVLYGEKIKNGHKVYTTIEIPDDDYSLMLDADYDMRLAETPELKKKDVTRCNTVQEMFDLMNKNEYNNWHQFDRHYGMPKKPFREDDEDENQIDHMDFVPDNSDEETWEKQADYEYCCDIIRKTLKPKQAEMLISIVLDGVPVKDYAKREGVSAGAISHRMETAIKNFKKAYPESSTFTSSQGYEV